MAGAHDEGRAGEEAVVRWLRRRGHVVLARNHFAAGGELDVVTRRGADLWFVEVRTRARGAPVDPVESVDAAKRARIVAAARSWLRNGTPFDRAFLAVASVRPRWWGYAVEVLPRAIDVADDAP